MFRKIILLALLCLGLNTAAVADEAATAPLQTGDALPAIALKDQFDKPQTVAADAQTLLFVIEKPASDLVNDYLMKQGKDFLAAHKAYFIADISGMPSMITKMFALPKMQERPYSILLAYDAEEVAFMPRKKNKVTVVKLAGGKVESVQHVDSEAALAEAF